MGVFEEQVSEVEQWRRAREKIEIGLRDHLDMARVLAIVTPILRATAGDVGRIRPLAPGLGELYDTMLAVVRLAESLARDLHGPVMGDDDEGVHTAVPGVAHQWEDVPGLDPGD